MFSGDMARGGIWDALNLWQFLCQLLWIDSETHLIMLNKMRSVIQSFDSVAIFWKNIYFSKRKFF